jgi:hypothetical protein
MDTRLCAKPGCGATATASLSFHYASRTAWVDDLEPEPSPMAHDLCAAHADRLRVPLGWAREDRRAANYPLFSAVNVA